MPKHATKTSKENGHYHYVKLDTDGNGRTSLWVDKKTKSRHFHRITKFVSEPAGRDEHKHALKGGYLKDVAVVDEGSSQRNNELESREVERIARRRRRGRGSRSREGSTSFRSEVADVSTGRVQSGGRGTMGRGRGRRGGSY